ncbi:MAG: biopolymer transporter ExbD [bacterium]|nr:biopolymer transporter ExbD [bacterium]MDT8395084.1 biopolymer transporter ExbD [bacterium]
MRSMNNVPGFRTPRRPVLELGMTPLIDIVFLLLLFFMLTSRFVVHEGIQVDLPVTDKPHAIAARQTHRLTVRSDGTIMLAGKSMTLRELGLFLDRQDDAFLQTPFEILSDRRASVQTVVSLLELLRDRGAARVSLGTVRADGMAAP